jgi:hypothetical protein
MPSIFDGFLKQLGQGDSVKDYKHAARLFVDNNYALSPKYDWLFHVFFDINAELSGINDTNQWTERGMLVKNIDLPKFSFDSKVLNNYNRPNLIQTKVKYDQLQVLFHDDSADVVRKFWFDYYNYYYRDSDLGYSDPSGGINPSYYAPNKYVAPQTNVLQTFGYTPRTTAANQSVNQYLQAIRIYSLHQKRFSEYTLINPMIVGFAHGTHSTQGGNTLEHSMTIMYESVLYAEGAVTRNTVKGFADLHYDKSPSPLTPIGGGTASILGPGGIVDAVSDAISSPSVGSIFGALRVAQTNDGKNLGKMASAELLQIGKDILRNGKLPSVGGSTNNRVFVPYTGSLANYPAANASKNPLGGLLGLGSATSNGSSIGASGALVAGGALLAAIGEPKLGAVAALAGVAINSAGKITGAPSDKVVNIDKNGNATGVSSLPNFNFFGAALAKAAEQKKAKEAAEAQKVSSGYAAAAAASDQFSRNAPVYDSNTNNLSSSYTGSNPLRQTPWSGSIVSASSDAVPAAEAAGFTQPASSYAGINIGSSTNPQG